MTRDDGRGRKERAQVLADGLACSWQLAEPWRAAFGGVPRDLFVPETAWVVPDGPEPGFAIDRDQDPGRWWDAVYSDASIVTQMDDGATDPRSGTGMPSCSCSAPGIVFRTLDALDVHDHHRVLEIGTGTGWTAALLSHRVGDRNLVSVEVDEHVAARADKNLAAAGYAPTLITGDGAAGWPDSAPYDRVHVTCAVERVPYAWVEQTRPGGVIVAPWAPPYGNGQLARLIVGRHGQAVGRFPFPASYMMLRSQRYAAVWSPHHADQARESATRIDPRSVAKAPEGADLTIGALVPGVARIPAAGDGSGAFSLLLVEAAAGSGESAWAAVDYVPGDFEYRVTWYGGRNLWEEVSDAYLRWISWGQPDRERFGLTVTSLGQSLWLDRPQFAIERHG